MADATAEETQYERSRQTLLQLNADPKDRDTARDVILCDLHRWMEELFATPERG